MALTVFGVPGLPEIAPGADNEKYLRTKKAKLGHLLKKV